MRVFLSWSGQLSRLIATAFAEWLPQILNDVDPYISVDIDSGVRWQLDVASALETTSFGLIFITVSNQERPWLSFEAGALAKAVGGSRVIPVAIDLSVADIKLPLGQFQAETLDEIGVWKLVDSLNSQTEKPRSDGHLEKAFSVWWPYIRDRVDAIKSESQTDSRGPERSDRDLLEEILTSVRSLGRSPVQDAAKILERLRLTPRDYVGAYMHAHFSDYHLRTHQREDGVLEVSTSVLKDVPEIQEELREILRENYGVEAIFFHQERPSFGKRSNRTTP